MAVELSKAHHGDASGSDGTTVGGRSGAPVILEAALPPSNRRGLGLGGSGGGSGGRSEHVGGQTMLTCSRAGEVLWTSVLPSRCVLLAGNSTFSAVGGADHSVTVFTAAGRRALPSLRPCAAGLAALVADHSHSLLVVGAAGDVLVWCGLPQQPRCTLRCSAAALISALVEPSNDAGDPTTQLGASAAGAPNVSGGSGGGGSGAARLLGASLLPNGQPLLLLPHGAFTYSPTMQAWLALGDEAFGASEYRSSLPSAFGPGVSAVMGGSAASNSLAALQQHHASASGRHETSAARLAASLAATPPDEQRLVSFAHLEHQLAACREIRQPAEYSAWLRLYAHALADKGGQLAERQVRELCDELLGPLDQPSLHGAPTAAHTPAAEMGETPETAPIAWQPGVLGLCKRTLLREVVLPELTTNRALQRILTEYLEQLASL